MTLLDIYTTFDRLTKLINSDTLISISLGFKIQTNLNSLFSFVKDYETKKNEIINKYAEDGEVKKDNPNYKKCLNELNELNNTEIQLPFLQKVKESEISTFTIPAYAIPAIQLMLEKEEEL